jgi:hypothetical protein
MASVWTKAATRVWLLQQARRTSEMEEMLVDIRLTIVYWYYQYLPEETLYAYYRHHT